MTTFETLFITRPDLSEDDERTLVGGLEGVVAAGGGNLVASDRMGRRRLAYPIQKYEDGVYTRFLYDSEAAVCQELERRARLSDKVLRWLTVRLDREWATDAKQQAARDAEARAEAARKAAAEAAAASETGAGEAASESKSAAPAEEPTAGEPAATEKDTKETADKSSPDESADSASS